MLTKVYRTEGITFFEKLLFIKIAKLISLFSQSFRLEEATELYSYIFEIFLNAFLKDYEAKLV